MGDIVDIGKRRMWRRGSRGGAIFENHLGVAPFLRIRELEDWRKSNMWYMGLVCVG